MDKDKMLAALARAKASAPRLDALDAQADEVAEIRRGELAALQTQQAIASAVGHAHAQAKSVIIEQHGRFRRRRDEDEARHTRQLVNVVTGLQVKPGPKLSMCMAAFMRHKQTSKAWEPKTKERWEFMLRLMVEGMGDRPVNEYTSDDLTEFMGRLLSYPANARKFAALDALTFRELVEVEGYDCLSEGTVSDHMGRVSGFFRWAKNQPTYYLSHNPAEGKTIKKVKRIKRKPFSEEQLVALFSHKNFVAREFMHPHYYWLMPLALMTGMRLNEACQLSLSDFIQVDGVDVIRCADLDGDEGDDDDTPGAAEEVATSLVSAPKRRKNENATRRVPVHKELIRLGLLRWVARQREAGEVQLFPELKAGRDGHGHAPSKWFGRYKEAIGVKGGRRYVFHSFRHAFISDRMNLGISEHRIAAIAGHETSLITGNTYWSDRDASMLLEVVNAVGLPESISSLLPSIEDVVFTRARRQVPSRLGARKSREQRIKDATSRKAKKAR